MDFNRFRAACVGVLVAAALAACGGGGGAGGPAASGQPSAGPAADGSLSLSLRSPGNFHRASFAGTALTGDEVVIEASGDAAALLGRSVFVLVETPEPLFQPLALFVEPGPPALVHVTIGGLPRPMPEGRYTGVMKLHACLDAGCGAELPGSPLSVPYDFDVKPELKLSPDALSLATSFGTPLAPVEVEVIMPFGGLDWSVLDNGFGLAAGVKRVGNKLVVTPNPLAAPGTYTARLTVESLAPELDGSGRPHFSRTDLSLRYTVTPVASPLVLLPASAVYTVALNDPASVLGRFDFGTQDAGSVDVVGVRFDTNPEAAAGHPMVHAWLSSHRPAFTFYSVEPCGPDAAAPNCLPAGTYTAAIVLRDTSPSGATTEVDLPVTMNIRP